MDCEQSAQETKIPTSRMPENMPLGSSYVPYQMWQDPSNPERGFNNGTIFPELNFPFLINGGVDVD